MYYKIRICALSWSFSNIIVRWTVSEISKFFSIFTFMVRLQQEMTKIRVYGYCYLKADRYEAAVTNEFQI